jgi:hypothetical protein
LISGVVVDIGQDRMMQTIVGIVGLLTTLGLVWSGRTRLRFGSYAATFLSVLEVLGILVGVISLGWIGLVLFALSNIVAVLVWSCVLAFRVEANLGPAVTETGEPMAEVKKLARQLRKVEGLRHVDPIPQSELIRALAERGRSIAEIEEIAPEIGKLHLLHRADLLWLAERFDRLLRLTGEPAAKAEEVAATVSASATVGAAPFAEMLDALITFYSVEPPSSEAV